MDEAMNKKGKTGSEVSTRGNEVTEDVVIRWRLLFVYVGSELY